MAGLLFHRFAAALVMSHSRSCLMTFMTTQSGSGLGCERPCQNRLVEDGALNGGNVSDVRKIGDAVVRKQGRSAHFVHALLRHLADGGWVGSPRAIGVDDDGHETLTFLEGVVPWKPPVPDWALSDAALTALARLVRQLHDLTAGSDLAGSAEVVCHGDLAPGNTVYRSTAAGLAPVAFLDWDLAGPGRRIEDVAHVCWQWLDLGPGVLDVQEAARVDDFPCCFLERGPKSRSAGGAHGFARTLAFAPAGWGGLIPKALHKSKGNLAGLTT